MLREICCVSVVGGWQTGFKDTTITFGPIFRSVGDLWNWQAVNLYTAEVEA
jgi:hypothetical protein